MPFVAGGPPVLISAVFLSSATSVVGGLFVLASAVFLSSVSFVAGGLIVSTPAVLLSSVPFVVPSGFLSCNEPVVPGGDATVSVPLLSLVDDGNAAVLVSLLLSSGETPDDVQTTEDWPPLFEGTHAS